MTRKQLLTYEIEFVLFLEVLEIEFVLFLEVLENPVLPMGETAHTRH